MSTTKRRQVTEGCLEVDLGGKKFEDQGEGEATFCQTSNGLASPSFNKLCGNIEYKEMLKC